ncbi:MAG: NAD-dependent epimerase/dehydratase family protein [Chloroflexi bacterium]|nr:MAG: NAD-dependent epimerase/dehydratase family protein [Chloroflexota bacterium]
MPENVIFGAGPLGLAVARRLSSLGKPVRLVNRSGKADAPPGVDVVAADVTDPAAAGQASEGASVVFHCASGPYGQWTKTLPPIMNGIIEGAAAAGARVVYGDNLYAYGPVDGPVREGLPYRPIGPTTRARAEVATTLMNAHGAGRVRATIGRASDFYGPHARQSKAGDVVFGRALAGKPAQALGNPDAPHTNTFIEDFAAGLVTLAERDEALGEVWHVPSAETITTRQFIDLVFQHLQRSPRLQVAPTFAIRLLGLVIPPMRAVSETLYQSERPWVVDHSKFARAFGGQPTPHPRAIAETISWFASQGTTRIPVRTS